jgi:hypothetical protein
MFNDGVIRQRPVSPLEKGGLRGISAPVWQMFNTLFDTPINICEYISIAEPENSKSRIEQIPLSSPSRKGEASQSLKTVFLCKNVGLAGGWYVQ